MSLIRVAIIGLSANSVTSWASAVHLPYLLSAHGRRSYQVTALLNSSASAATNAREHFGLPKSVKTYGDPHTLASDPDIDLVVCTTHASVHFDTIAPSLAAGKHVFVEWPLVTNMEQAVELKKLGSVSGAWEHSIIGLQGRVAPPVQQLIALLEQGRIGKVLSSNVEVTCRVPPLPLPLATLPDSMAFIADKSSGASSVTLGYGHTIDMVHAVLGEWKQHQVQVQVERPEITIIGVPHSGAGKSIVTDVPDLISAHGTLKGQQYVVKEATLSMRWRNSVPFMEEPSFTWTLNGERGDIQLVSPDGPFLGTNSYNQPVVIKIYHHATNTVEEAQWKWQDWQTEFDINGRSTAELYERYAAWVHSGEKHVAKGREWPTLADSLARMREVTEILSISAQSEN